MHVIGTAGHVDHGKTSLLRALTGMEPSRLAEERARGMTMQLGFVWLKAAGREPIGVIDVPGHADYRLHALTGASAFDAFLFVCAADDGWMPQSEEHLFALAAFGVAHGVVVLTKADLVDAARVAEVAAELEVRFFEALGREVPVVPCAAGDAAALENVRRALFRELDALPADKDAGRPQMYVDRAFTVQGQGTVVTGTLRHGKLTERQLIEVLPSGKKVQIRSIQSYGVPVRVARPSARVALQLANLSVADVPKDSQLVDPGQVSLTSQVDVRLRLFGSYALNPRKTPEVLVAHGGVKTRARLIVMGPALDPRGPAWHVRLKLEVPRAMRFDDRCLVVSAGGDRVLGGGRVVDEAPATSITVAADLLAIVRDFSADEYLALNLAKSGALRVNDLEKRTSFPPPGAVPGVVRLGDWLADPERVTEWRDAIAAQIERHHARRSTDEGLAESALVKTLRLDQDLVHCLLRAMKDDRRLQQVGPYLKLFGFKPKADQSSKLAARLEEIAADATAAVHTHFELGVDGEEPRRVLGRFVADGKIVRLGDDAVIGSAAFAAIAAAVKALITEAGPVTAAQVRDRIRLGRNKVILVLQAMDDAKITHRIDDKRKLV